MEKEVVSSSLTPSWPWFVVEVLEGVDLDNMYTDGFAEIAVDNKFQGKYLNICRVVRTPPLVKSDEYPNAIIGSMVCVWATAIEKFNLLSYGELALVRNPDIFLEIDPGTPLYIEIMSKYGSTEI